MTHANLVTRTLQPLRLLLYVSPLVVLLLLVPYVTNPYQTFLLSYGLVMAIAALGFNLLLGYTGLLSFGHSAYFGVGAYAVAFMVKYLHITSMELFLLGGVPGHCGRHGPVWLRVRALYADLLFYPHHGAVTGAVESGL